MSRKSDISALLAKADEQLTRIVTEYESSLQKHTIDATLRVDIKNFFENLRSVLDYLAHDVREKFCPTANSKERFYFPILPDAAQFATQSDRWFPGLQAAKPALWSELERCQPYQTDQSWLGHFNKLNNENKHGALVPQTRRERSRIEAKISGGGSVSWDPGGVKFGSGVYIGGVPVDPRTQMPIPDERLAVTKIIWVDFVFDGIGVSAITLLKQALAGVKKINAAIIQHI